MSSHSAEIRPSGRAWVRTHGGPDAHGVPLHDFSTNSNACGPCEEVLQAVRRADARTYPDSGYTLLRARLAAFHGVEEWRILLAGSSSEFIFRMTAMTALVSGKGNGVWLPAHGYGDYAQAARAFGLSVLAHPSDSALAWACEPSSPLGAADTDVAELAALRSERASGPAVVLDCAYQPLRLSGSPTLSAAQRDTVWQLFTPNKALGLTGVRAAYAIAPLGAGSEAMAASLEQLCPSWPVGAHGVEMLQAWTTPSVQAWLAESRSTLQAWKARQIELCSALGWTCLPSDANFYCAQPALKGAGLQQALQTLRSRSIKLRDTASFGLPDHVRLGVLPPASQDALHDAWQQINNHSNSNNNRKTA